MNNVQTFCELPYRKSFWRWPASAGLLLALLIIRDPLDPVIMIIESDNLLRLIDWLWLNICVLCPWFLFISPIFRGNSSDHFRTQLRQALFNAGAVIIVYGLVVFSG